MRQLPLAARLFVIAVIGLASAVLIARVPSAAPPSLAMFALLALASSLASGLKLRLPLGSSASNLSVSYTIDFAALLLLGPDPTMFVAGLSALTQSTIRIARRNPLYRVLFNVAALILTVQMTGWAFHALGGQRAIFDLEVLAKPLVAAALVYYLANTGFVALAVGLSSRQPLWQLWQSNFLWTAPSYLVGAGAAAATAALWVNGWGWLLPLTVAPVYLTFRSYRIYADRIATEQRHNDEVVRLHNETVVALRAAKESEQRYALAADGSNDGLWDWNVATGGLYCADRWKLMLGLPTATPVTSLEDWFQYVHADDLAGLRAVLERHLSSDSPHFEHEYRIRHADGGIRWMLCRGVAVRDEANCPIRMAGSQTDITEPRRVQDELAHAALHDHLTRLPNRALFADLLTRSLAKAHRSATYLCAVLFIDLDHFKLVNDSLGHLVGDRFLTAIGQRLQVRLRPSDALARLGGDEFAVLVDDIGGPADASAIADRLQHALAEPFDIHGREIYASASIGIAFSSDGYATADDLLRDADTAMYRAKALGRSRSQVFDPEMHAGAMNRLTLDTDLRRALERGEFIVHYQPIVELESEEVCGFEALVRWKRADGRVIGPSEFIPIAEETGLIVPLTKWVLNEACHQVAEWQRVFSRPLSVTVNVSTKLFDRPALVEEVRQAIADSGMIPGTLRLEITESFLVNDSTIVARRLEELRAIPVKLYLDDFGTGYSSLSYLHRYRLDALKIDRSFVSRMGSDDAPLVAVILSLARELGIGVIAEGVETALQAKELLALNCPHAQGHHFSHPLSVEAAHGFLSRPSRTRLVSESSSGACAAA